MNPIEAYIRQSAAARGIDPDVAVRVALSEGGLKDPTQQSYAPNPHGAGREPSYGPFQLYVSGRGAGLGDRAVAAGIDPRDPGQWQRGVDFALNEAANKGWGQWYGAAKAGIGNRAGIGGAHASDLSPAAQDFVKNNPQPGGFGPGVPDPNAPVGPMPGAPPAGPEGPPQSPLGAMMAGFASGFGGMGGGQPADAGQPRVIQEGGFGATMAAQQGADQAKQLAFGLSPDIEKMLALAPKPFARKGAALVG